MKINKYKLINMQTLQSQIQYSVEEEETQGKVNHESREASATGFAAPDPSTGPEAPSEEILPKPIWQLFKDKPIHESFANISCKGTCTYAAVAKLNLKIQVSLK